MKKYTSYLNLNGPRRLGPQILLEDDETNNIYAFREFERPVPARPAQRDRGRRDRGKTPGPRCWCVQDVHVHVFDYLSCRGAEPHDGRCRGRHPGRVLPRSRPAARLRASAALPSLTTDRLQARPANLSGAESHHLHLLVNGYAGEGGACHCGASLPDHGPTPAERTGIQACACARSKTAYNGLAVRIRVVQVRASVRVCPVRVCPVRVCQVRVCQVRVSGRSSSGPRSQGPAR
jgi:hypothetical protein